MRERRERWRERGESERDIERGREERKSEREGRGGYREREIERERVRYSEREGETGRERGR